jgi:F-type H+-transporting ATPase subunit a
MAKRLWSRIGKWPRIGIIALACCGLIAVGRLYFGTAQPHVNLPPEQLWHVGSFPITNTMLAAWFTIVVLGVLCFFATRRMELIPRGLQNVMEALVEGLANFIDSVAGEENGRRFFPVLATIFIFVLANAWLSMLPGFMSIGFEHEMEGHMAIVPFFRGANTDINVPLALALVSFVFVEYWGFRTHGFRSYTRKFVNVGRSLGGMKNVLRGRIKQGVGGLLSGLIDIFVGFVEFISELIRVLSFSFRLFGNMTAGEILIFSLIFLLPWLVVIPFYGLELFLGFIQALIFCGLSLVFVVMAVSSHNEH